MTLEVALIFTSTWVVGGGREVMLTLFQKSLGCCLDLWGDKSSEGMSLCR